MRRQLLRVLAVTAMALGAGWQGASAQTPDSVEVPPVPAAIAAPDGHVPFLKGYAVGTQNFVCVRMRTGFAWRFIGPQATLFLTINGEISEQIATHFLSTNPAEAVARATWQYSFDTSRVWARAIASSDDPAYVEAGAIPWLLLETVGTDLGPTGGPVLAATTYIHRVSTSGGLAPLSGCGKTSDVGGLVLVPYTADYFFYQTARSK